MRKAGVQAESRPSPLQDELHIGGLFLGCPFRGSHIACDPEFWKLSRRVLHKATLAG